MTLSVFFAHMTPMSLTGPPDMKAASYEQLHVLTPVGR
jgi:hypothetical protein